MEVKGLGYGQYAWKFMNVAARVVEGVFIFQYNALIIISGLGLPKHHQDKLVDLCDA